MLSGCEEPKSKQVVLKGIDTWIGDRVYKQLFTYSEQPVQIATVQLKDTQIKIVYKNVYLTNQSKLVLRNGTPITDVSGLEVYWEESGKFVNTQYKVVPESWLFTIDKKPMKDNTAILIKSYFDEAKASYEKNK